MISTNVASCEFVLFLLHQVSSKIAGPWKADGGAGGGRDSPVSGSRLPVLTKSPPLHASKPSSLPPSGVRGKPVATNTLASAGKSHSVVEGISKSSTYEKIPSEFLNQGSTPHQPTSGAKHNSSSISNNKRGNYQIKNSFNDI